MRELILIEILAVPAEQSRGRHNPRAVKRKMSKFPTKARAGPAPRQVFCYAVHIRVVAPLGPPVHPAPLTGPLPEPATTRATTVPTRTGRPVWVEHVRAWRASGLTRTAYCDRHGLNPRAFHLWVARARQTLRQTVPRKLGSS